MLSNARVCKNTGCDTDKSLFRNVIIGNKAVNLQRAMKMLCGRLRWTVCIAALLLLCIVSPDMPQGRAEQSRQAVSSGTYISEISEGVSDDAAFNTPGDDIFAYMLGTNRWGISSSTPYMQKLSECSLSSGNHLQRTATSHLCDNIATESWHDSLFYTVASIRFHIGYFIYHRCQMRC